MGGPIISATINGPQQCVGRLELNAKREPKQRRPADVDKGVLSPVIEFVVVAHQPKKVNDRVCYVEHDFLRTKEAPQESVIRLVKQLPVTQVLHNGFGATSSVQNLMAYFNTADIPMGDFDIVLPVQGLSEMTIPVRSNEMVMVQ